MEDGIKPKVDYDLMIENIHDLNLLAGEGVPQIFMSPDANYKVSSYISGPKKKLNVIIEFTSSFFFYLHFHLGRGSRSYCSLF